MDPVEERDTDLRWCHSDIQLADGMTKKKVSCRILSSLRTPRWKLVLDTTYTPSKQRPQVGVTPLDDLSKVGRQTHDGVLMLSNSLGHGILANTEADRPQSLARAGKYENKSCNVPKPEVRASNLNCADDNDTRLVLRSRSTRRLELDGTMELSVTTGSCTKQLDFGSGCVCSIRVCLNVFSVQEIGSASREFLERVIAMLSPVLFVIVDLTTL